MENVSARTLAINPPAAWFAAAGNLMDRVWSTMRGFGGVMRKEPVRSGATPRHGRAGRLPSPRTSPWTEAGELPESYGHTRVVAMPVSPYLVHVYWDLAEQDRARAISGNLRFRETTTGESFDVKVDLAAKNWYVHLWSPNKRYTVELGLERADTVARLASSNPVETPRAWPVSEPAVPAIPREPTPTAPAAGALPAEAVAPRKRRDDSAPSPGAEMPIPRPASSSASEILRKRLWEFYTLRRRESGEEAEPEPVAPGARPERRAVEGSLEIAVERALSKGVLRKEGAPGDVTALLESQFLPGQSSVQLGLSQPSRAELAG